MDKGRYAFVATLLLVPMSIVLSCLLSANIYLMVAAATPHPILILIPTPRLIGAPTPSTQTAPGCGSRGGPGVRLANGRCASWDDLGQTPTPRTR